MLEIKNLTKRYGDKKAVDDLSLTINAGEIYGFIGHNGAGKTTTLKSVVGILKFDEGDIFVDGVSVKENPGKTGNSLYPRQSRPLRVYVWHSLSQFRRGYF